MAKPPEKGQRRALNISKQGNHRFFVGLGWDVNPNKSLIDRIKEFISGKEVFHDLDLSCFTYDKDHNPIDIITGNPNEISDKTGAIYHSGDDKDGLGSGDDEQISVELSNLPAEVNHIIFKASIKSNHNFGDVAEPEIRIVDAYSQRSIAKKQLTDPEGHKASRYIFAEIYKTNNKWNIHHIGEYLSWGSNSSWQRKLTAFLTKQPITQQKDAQSS